MDQDLKILQAADVTYSWEWTGLPVTDHDGDVLFTAGGSLGTDLMKIGTPGLLSVNIGGNVPPPLGSITVDKDGNIINDFLGTIDFYKRENALTYKKVNLVKDQIPNSIHAIGALRHKSQ
jgi:hypothetical protein